MNQRRVVVTGLGVVSPLGSAVEGFWSNLCAGISGVGQITLFDASGYRSRIAGEVRGFKCPPVLPERKARRLDRFALFGLAAAFEAWQDSGLQSGDLEPFEGGVIIGSSHGGEGSMLHQVERAIHPLLGPVSPLMVPRMLDNMASAQVAITLGLQGPNFGVSSACATGGHAIGESAEIIRRGDATVMLCGGAEACITPLTLAGDEALGALSCRNDAPERASRPFDRGRDGFVLSEGAGVLVLEELSNAQSRGAKTYCEVSGYGATSDAFHETKPRVDGLGAARAMHRAMTSSRISTRQVSAVFAHATSTPGGDKAEGQALKAALGSALEELPVTAIKSTLGHQLGAAGAVQAVAACKAVQEQKLPPTINLDIPDPDCHMVQIPKTVLAMPLRHVLSNSLGFGGHNAILLFSRFP